MTHARHNLTLTVGHFLMIVERQYHQIQLAFITVWKYVLDKEHKVFHHSETQVPFIWHHTVQNMITSSPPYVPEVTT
jgi:hypothetical protein